MPAAWGAAVTGIAPQGTFWNASPTGPTKADDIEFIVTFDSAVRGFDASDVTVNRGGSVTTGADSVTTLSSSQYLVTIPGVAGDGALSLSIRENAVREDNPAFGPSTAVTIDNTPPDIQSTTPPSGTVTQTKPTLVRINWTESVLELVGSDIDVSSNGNYNSGSFSGSGATYNIPLDPARRGVIKINIAAAVCRDIAGNDNFAADQWTVIWAYLVDPLGGGDYRTIQAGIQDPNVVDGDALVCRKNRDYREVINFLGKNLIIQSEDPTDPTAVYNTKIQPPDGVNNAVVTFQGTESSACILSGFRITGGVGHLDSQNGDLLGGGIYGAGCHATISNNLIALNESTIGGGIYDCDGLILHNVILRNHASDNGGGLANCDGDIWHNDILSNRVDSGRDGTGLFNCQASIINTIIFDNYAGTTPSSLFPQLHSSATPSYSCIANWSGGGTGNISPASPGFVNAASNPPDLHLAASSACRDSGRYLPGVKVDSEDDVRPQNDAGVGGDGSKFDIGIDERNTGFLVDLGAELQVQPEFGTTANGLAGGPFVVTNEEYIVKNVGNANLHWTAASNQAWLTITPNGGTLAPGSRRHLILSINDQANGLANGAYPAMITYTNTDNGYGNVQYEFVLNVGTLVDPPVMVITPNERAAFAGSQGGPFSALVDPQPSPSKFTITNTGGSNLPWTATRVESWLTLSPSSGSVPPGQSRDVTLSINSAANALAEGVYQDLITFTNTFNGDGDDTRDVGLAVGDAQETGALMNVEAGNITASGDPGGPFTQNRPTIQITNVTTEEGKTLSWSVSYPTTDWLTLSPSSGSRAPGENQLVTVTVNSNANSLAAGVYTVTLTFTNNSNGDQDPETRQVILTIGTDCAAQYGCFVERQYLDFLGRAAEPAGRQFYIDHLCVGTMTLAQVVRNFIASPEFAESNGFISRCYFCIFNNNSTTPYNDPGYRIPDYPGLKYHKATMEGIIASTGNVTLAQQTVALQFISSPEWQLRVGTLDHSEFVSFLYENILGRPAEPAGHAFHLANLNSGAVTREDLVVQFLVSPEAQEKYANHTYVVMAYLGLLDRGAEKAGFDYHMGTLISGAVDPVTFLYGFIFSPEYINRLTGRGCTGWN